MPVTVKFIRYGDIFDSADLDAGRVELEYVPPAMDIPEDQETESWCWGDDKPEPSVLLWRLETYRRFLER